MGEVLCTSGVWKFVWNLRDQERKSRPGSLQPWNNYHKEKCSVTEMCPDRFKAGNSGEAGGR